MIKQDMRDEEKVERGRRKRRRRERREVRERGVFYLCECHLYLLLFSGPTRVKRVIG